MKAQWKQKPLQYVRDKRVTDLEQANIRIAELEKKNEEHTRVGKHMHERLLNALQRLSNCDDSVLKYEWLLNAEVMLPTEDGFKYFNNAQELDKYVEGKVYSATGRSYSSALTMSMQAKKNQLLAGLNSIFDEEYLKYSTEIQHGNTGSLSQETNQETTQ